MFYNLINLRKIKFGPSTDVECIDLKMSPGKKLTDQFNFPGIV